MLRSIAPIIPVLDLMIGQVVLATGGNRHEYRPVHSKLTTSSEPVSVAKAIFNQTGCDHLYLADIDSFAGAEPNWRVYNELVKTGFSLWLDADWLTKARYQCIADRITANDRVKIIVSSETMNDMDDFQRIGELAENGLSPVFSLDLKGASIITKSGELNQRTALELIREAFDQGARELIVLDLENVGTDRGCLESDSWLGTMFAEISQELPGLRLVSGGGIRSAEDAQDWLNAGCSNVLVASAIHDCRFTPDDVSNLRPFSSSR